MRGVLLALVMAFFLSPFLAHAQSMPPSIAQERLYESLRREVTDKLQASGKFSSITPTSKTTLKLKTLAGLDLALSLDTVVADISQRPTQRPDIVAKFVQALIASAEPPSAPVTRDVFVDRLRLVIRHKNYLAELTAQSATPIWRPFAGPALQFVAIDQGERLEIALKGAGGAYGIADDDLFALGRDQLKRFLAEMEVEDASGVRAFTVGDAAYSPSLLLLDEPWGKVEKDFGAGFVVAIPDRNTLLAAPAKNAAQLRVAVDLVARSRKTVPMIPELLQRQGNTWVVSPNR
jgi:hypothetical protein